MVKITRPASDSPPKQMPDAPEEMQPEDNAVADNNVYESVENDKLVVRDVVDDEGDNQHDAADPDQGRGEDAESKTADTQSTGLDGHEDMEDSVPEKKSIFSMFSNKNKAISPVPKKKMDLAQGIKFGACGLIGIAAVSYIMSPTSDKGDVGGTMQAESSEKSDGEEVQAASPEKSDRELRKEARAEAKQQEIDLAIAEQEEKERKLAEIAEQREIARAELEAKKIAQLEAAEAAKAERAAEMAQIEAEAECRQRTAAAKREAAKQAAAQQREINRVAAEQEALNPIGPTEAELAAMTREQRVEAVKAAQAQRSAARAQKRAEVLAQKENRRQEREDRSNLMDVAGLCDDLFVTQASTASGEPTEEPVSTDLPSVE